MGLHAAGQPSAPILLLPHGFNPLACSLLSPCSPSSSSPLAITSTHIPCVGFHHMQAHMHVGFCTARPHWPGRTSSGLSPQLAVVVVMLKKDHVGRVVCSIEFSVFADYSKREIPHPCVSVLLDAASGHRCNKHCPCPCEVGFYRVAHLVTPRKCPPT